MTIEDWTRIADRFVRVLETGDVADLERLYHPDLRFTVRTAGTAFDRDEALANFRQNPVRRRQCQHRPSGRLVQRVYLVAGFTWIALLAGRLLTSAIPGSTDSARPSQSSNPSSSPPRSGQAARV
jgi:hypothetical protein